MQPTFCIHLLCFVCLNWCHGRSLAPHPDPGFPPRLLRSIFVTCLITADVVGVKLFELKLPFKVHCPRCPTFRSSSRAIRPWRPGRHPAAAFPAPDVPSFRTPYSRLESATLSPTGDGPLRAQVSRRAGPSRTRTRLAFATPLPLANPHAAPPPQRPYDTPHL